MKQMLTNLHGFLGRYRLLPSFDEDTVFLLALVVLVVWLIDADARTFAEQVRAQSSKISLMILLGMGFAFYTAFFASFKNEIQKFYMFWFAVLINFLSAFAAITLLNGSGESVFSYITPVINIVISILLVVFWHADVLDASSLPHKSSTFSNVLYGTLIVLGFTLLAEYIWDTPWPSVLTAAIGYATLFNGTVTSYLPQIFGKRDRKIASLDAVVNRGIDHMVQNLSKGKNHGISIVTDEGIKDLSVTPEYENDIDTFLADEVRKLNRTSPVIAVTSIGTYTFKRYWFSPTRQEMAIIVDAYPNDGTTGYQFCQMIKYNSEGELGRYRGLMYLNKITNIFA